MSKVVITGATGFVGGALTRALVDAGHEVTALVRSTSNRFALAQLPVKFAVGDVTQPESLSGVFASAEIVVHAAGMLGQAGVAESDYHQLHVAGTRNVLDAIAATGNQPRILYVSSPGVLGSITSKKPADETAPYAPSNVYERSKAAAEQVVLASDLPIVIARPEFIYGPTDLHVLGLFRSIQRGVFFYIGDGHDKCHPTYINDAVMGMLKVLEQGRIGEIYHITGPRAVTFRELAVTIARHLGVRGRFPDVPRPVAMLGATLLEKVLANPPLSRDGVAFFSESRHFSWYKALTELDYRPQYDLDLGIRETIAWYRNEGLL